MILCGKLMVNVVQKWSQSVKICRSYCLLSRFMDHHVYTYNYIHIAPTYHHCTRDVVRAVIVHDVCLSVCLWMYIYLLLSCYSCIAIFVGFPNCVESVTDRLTIMSIHLSSLQWCAASVLCLWLSWYCSAGTVYSVLFITRSFDLHVDLDPVLELT